MTEDNRIDRIRAVLDEVSREKTGDGFYFASKLAEVKAILDSAPPAPQQWQAEARIKEQRATSLGYCEHVVELLSDGEEETCSNLRLRGQIRAPRSERGADRARQQGVCCRGGRAPRHRLDDRRRDERGDPTELHQAHRRTPSRTPGQGACCMTESMASEPAEPTTRQDEVIKRAAAVLRVASDYQITGEYYARSLAAERLLADPAQTTELEDRAELADQLASANEHIEEQDARISQLEAEVVKQRIIATNATDHWRQSSILASLRAANAQRGLELRKLNDAMARKNRIIAKRTAERDALLPRLAELTKQAGKERTTEWLNICTNLPPEEWPPAPAYKGPMVPAAERDERQARIDDALAKLNASDQATSWEAMYDLVEEAKTVLRGWASAEPSGEAVPVEALRRAALVGDQQPADDRLPLSDRARMWLEGQPKAEELKPRCCIGPFADGTHAPGCLDACQDCGGNVAEPRRCRCRDAPRAVEEADDAAGDAP